MVEFHGMGRKDATTVLTRDRTKLHERLRMRAPISPPVDAWAGPEAPFSQRRADCLWERNRWQFAQTTSHFATSARGRPWLQTRTAAHDGE
jgi:hypothetical protein